MWLELLAVAGLILLNGFFACAELAIVNTRRSRVKQLAEEGNPNARLVAGFQEDSERFLATIQIGVTVAAATAAAIGGAAAVEHLKPALLAIPLPFMESIAEPLAVGIIVLAISFFTLILGELVPKILALRNPEQLAVDVDLGWAREPPLGDPAADPLDACRPSVDREIWPGAETIYLRRGDQSPHDRGP